jgi:hypothetical protein
VWRDLGGDDQNGIQTQEVGYDGVTMTFRLENLTPGVIYKIASLAVNDQGDSLTSDYILIGASALPEPPVALYKDSLQSNKTALSIYWDSSPETDMPLTGYILQVADYGSVDFQPIYSGSNRPGDLQHTHNGFITGAKYTFRVVTTNFNGESEPSAPFTFNACTRPMGMGQPTRNDELSETGSLWVEW